ncbi:protein SLX4IP [Stigmatopora argus]
MAPVKFVIKCGNFAVLVDLYVLPLGSQEDASWFATSHIEEVTTLIRDYVDLRLQQYMESLEKGRQPKQKKQLAPASALIVKGKYFNLVANFLKRHVNLRCIVKQHHGDLRVFPERCVVCVSRPEDATAHYAKPSSTATELSEQSRSEYFSRDGQIPESFNGAAKIKKTVLQKVAQISDVQQEKIEQRTQDQNAKLRLGNPEQSSLDSDTGFGRTLNSSPPQNAAVPSSNTIHSPDSPSIGLSPQEILPGTRRSKRSKPSDWQDPRPPKAMRTGPAGPPAATQPQSSTQIPRDDSLPPSKAFPVSEFEKTTAEVEPLTPGKRDQRLPLASNNTAQTKQNRLAASGRGLSVKFASSRSSIGSRSAGEPEERKDVPRTSRLRRHKRS